MAHGKPPYHALRPLLAIVMIPNKPSPILDESNTLFIFCFVFVFVFFFLLFFSFVSYLTRPFDSISIYQ